ncbi:MAG: hypothetical protein NUW21_11540 [Elusimicrobia bacterium]|nr:hypothetical protein [Elusimicrobiota bacterium]
MSLSLALGLALASSAAAAAPHRPAEHGEHYLPVTLGPEYIDLVTQLRAKQGRRPDFAFRQNVLKGLRVSETVDREQAPGGHTGVLLVVREAKDKKRARALAREVIEPEDWADVSRSLPRRTLTVAEHLKAVKKNAAFIDGHVSPGYVTVDLVWVERQLGRDLDGVVAALYLARSPRGVSKIKTSKPLPASGVAR